MGPELTTHPLIRADGSATFSTNLFTILAAVNGPVEVQRRDELPEEAAIEVNIRPSSGIGGPRERWLESTIASTLKSVLLVHMHPRTLIQVTLQVMKEPNLKMKRRILDIAIIPALVNASFLALADGGLPLGRTMSAAFGVISERSELVVEPEEKQIVNCKSVHAMAFTTEGEMLLNQSVGEFELKQWQNVCAGLKQHAMAATAKAGADRAMVNGNAESTPWLREALEEDVQRAGAWRETG